MLNSITNVQLGYVANADLDSKQFYVIQIFTVDSMNAMDSLCKLLNIFNVLIVKNEKKEVNLDQLIFFFNCHRKY